MGTPLDLYAILEVAPTADFLAIRLAYRRLARRHHPDLGGGNRRMVILNEAWRVLRSPEERALYDARRVALEAATHSGRSAEQAPASATATPVSWAGVRPVPTPPAAALSATRRAVPCGSTPGSTVLSFGRYEGWSLAQLAEHDPDYLEWLARTPIGRGLTREIRAVLTRPPAGLRTGAELRRAFAGR